MDDTDRDEPAIHRGLAVPSHHVRKSLRGAGSFVVSGSISSSGSSVFPIGAVTAAPLCWLLLWINRGRLERTDRLAGLVALCGVAYGVVQVTFA